MFYYHALGLTLGRKQPRPQKTALILLNYQSPGVHDVRAGPATVIVLVISGKYKKINC